jgi:ribosomal protein S18 acetylase RimI-like enzyme
MNEPTLRIPKAVCDLLAEHLWKHMDFARTLEGHREGDTRSGRTSAYFLYKNRDDPYGCFSYEEAKKLQAAGALPAGFCTIRPTVAVVNQHAGHSLQQFLHDAQKLYAEHLARVEALRGTPHGRSPASEVIPE